MAGAEPQLSPSEKILIILPDRDSPPKTDWRHVFLPEATALKDAYAKEGALVTLSQIPVPTVDPKTLTIAPGAKQAAFELAARTVIDLIRSTKWDRIIFLCHGWDAGLQVGFRMRKQKVNDARNLADLVGALKASSSLKTLTLFACSAGDEPASATSSPGTGDNSIADYLRDQAGCTVIAHWTVGHATRNPDIILFAGSTVPLIGGVAWPERATPAYRNTLRLLTQRKDSKTGKAPGQSRPKGGKRLAFASLPLCRSVADLQALFSMEPAF